MPALLASSPEGELYEMKENEVMTTVSNLRQEGKALLWLFSTAATQIETLSHAVTIVCRFIVRSILIISDLCFFNSMKIKLFFFFII